MGNVDYKQLRDFQKKLEALKANELMEEMTKEAGQRLLAKVIKRTPVDTGRLRQEWSKKNIPLVVTTNGVDYTTKIVNGVEYASYVEYGHRTKNGMGWVEGRYFLTKSEMELEDELQSLIDAKLMQKLGETLK